MTSMLLSQNMPASAASSTKGLQQNALIVIDSGVANISTLITDITGAQADVLLLSAERDGIAQITEALAGYERLASLHIESHGKHGQLPLGNTQLSCSTLAPHSGELVGWAALLKNRDNLLYGSQVAKGAMGRLFVPQLRQLTGAKSAAS
ncbi:MAG: DUF4347 domain-containing protein, partial [Phormidesmis sp.]